jgi:hypothetical protein
MLEFDSRRFTDIFDVHTLFSVSRNVTFYDVGKLAFNLLSISLSRIQALQKGSQVHELTGFLQSYPPFHLIENDPLELEKVKATQVEFLKV